jgi:hypothetical protein
LDLLLVEVTVAHGQTVQIMCDMIGSACVRVLVVIDGVGRSTYYPVERFLILGVAIIIAVPTLRSCVIQTLTNLIAWAIIVAIPGAGATTTIPATIVATSAARSPSMTTA